MYLTSEEIETRYKGAVIDDTAKIGKGTLIGTGASIGAGAVVESWVYIESYAHIDDGAVIGENVIIESGASIGAWSIIKSGAVICRGAVIADGAFISTCAIIGVDRKNVTKSISMPSFENVRYATAYICDDGLIVHNGCLTGRSGNTYENVVEMLRQKYPCENHPYYATMRLIKEWYESEKGRN